MYFVFKVIFKLRNANFWQRLSQKKGIDYSQALQKYHKVKIKLKHVDEHLFRRKMVEEIVPIWPSSAGSDKMFSLMV